MLLAFLVCAALPVAEVPRPAGPAKEPAAQVLVIEREVQIDPGGGQKRFKALGGMLLQKTDLVVVGPGAWVALVILGNEHVVRLDDDLSLKVSDLALLNAPKQTRSPVQQLDTLLTRQERQRTERLIGWHASQTAANTQPVKAAPRNESNSSPKLELKAKKSQKREYDSDDLVEAEEAVVPPPPRPPPPSPTPAPAGGSQKEEGSSKTSAPQKPAPGAAPAVDAELQACVEGAVLAWGAEVKAKLGNSVLVSATLREGEVVVRLPLGLPAPACAAAYFTRRGVSAGWTNVMVPLK